MQKGGRSPSFFNAHFLNQISHICNERLTIKSQV